MITWNKIKNNLNAVTILLLFIIYTISYSLYNIVFDSGDDIIIQKIIQGYFAGNPDVHLIFINVIIGYILKPFYLFNNSIYWYSFLMLFFQALSFGIILKIELQKKYNFIYYIVLLLLFQYLIIRLQFTTVSALLTIAGFLLLKQNVEAKKKNILLSLTLLYFGFLIRDEMFYLMIAFLGTFVLMQQRELLLANISNRSYLIQFSAFILILISSNWIDNNHYQQKEWKYYADYNSVRGRLNDSPMFLAYYEDHYASDVAQKSDLDLFSRNFIALKDYDLEKLRQIHDASRSDSKAFTYKLKSLKTNALQKNNLIMYIFMLFIVGYALMKRKIQLVIPLLLFAALFTYISLEMTFKNRLSLPILLVFFIFYASVINRKWFTYLTVPFVFILLFTNKTFFIGFSESPKIEIADLPTDKLIVPLNSTLTTFHPFKLNEINAKSNIVNLGWLGESPLVMDKLKQKNINVSQHFSLYDDKTTNSFFYYFVSNKSTLKLFNFNLKLKGMKFVPLKNYKDVYTIQKL